MDKFLIGLSFRQITMLATRLLGSHEVKASKESATQKKKKKIPHTRPKKGLEIQIYNMK